MNVMPISELTERVVKICKANGVKRLDSIRNEFLLEDIRKYGKQIYESVPDVLQEPEKS